MKFSSIITIVAASALTAEAFLIPSSVHSLTKRNAVEVPQKRDISTWSDLWKRKGGGGGGKSGSSSSSSSGSSSSGSSSSGGARTGSTSNAGGATSAGSGAPRSYGGGRYYSGGATAPYTAGGKTPRGIAPIGLLGIGALAFFPGLWLYSAYSYPYSHPYGFYNATARQNQSKPINCLCQQYSVCGCDDNDDTTYLDSVIGNGTDLNSTLVRAATVNGTDTIFINGTLPNGTTASGGTDSAAGIQGKAVQTMGWVIIGSAMTFAMWML